MSWFEGLKRLLECIVVVNLSPFFYFMHVREGRVWFEARPCIDLRRSKGLLECIVGVNHKPHVCRGQPSNILYGVTQIPNLINGVHTIDTFRQYLAKEKWPTIK